MTTKNQDNEKPERTPTSWDELPATITKYLTAHRTRDMATAITAFTEDSMVTDEGQTHRGLDEISAWLTDAVSGYSFTTEFTSATRLHAMDFDVTQRLEGDFPGGVADLHFRFTMDGSSIRRLVIEV